MLAGVVPQCPMFPPGREYSIVYHQYAFVDVNACVGAAQFPFTKSCQDAPLLAVGRNGIRVRGFGGQIPPIEQMASFERQVEAERALSAECPPALKAPLLAAGIFTLSDRAGFRPMSISAKDTSRRQGAITW